jgi:hypothetical protein
LTVATLTADRHHLIERWAWAAGGAATLGLLWTRDPNPAGSYGFCPLRALTGLDCPFCGGLRGTYALMHGDVATALDHNLLLPLFLGVAMVLAVRAWARTGRSSGKVEASVGPARSVAGVPVAVWWALVAVTALYFVVRNVPWFPYLDASA